MWLVRFWGNVILQGSAMVVVDDDDAMNVRYHKMTRGGHKE